MRCVWRTEHRFNDHDFENEADDATTSPTTTAMAMTNKDDDGRDSDHEYATERQHILQRIITMTSKEGSNIEQRR